MPTESAGVELAYFVVSYEIPRSLLRRGFICIEASERADAEAFAGAVGLTAPLKTTWPRQFGGAIAVCRP